MKTDKYIKPAIEVVGLELEGAVMGTSDLNEDGNYTGPAGAPKRRRSFWENEE